MMIRLLLSILAIAPLTQLGEATPPRTRTRSSEGFADYLKRELRARNWTARYLALRAGVSPSTIVRLMNNDRSVTLTTARRIHEALEGPNAERLAGVHLPLRPGDPVRRVTEALRSDTLLDLQGVHEVLRVYTAQRRRANQSITVNQETSRPDHAI